MPLIDKSIQKTSITNEYSSRLIIVYLSVNMYYETASAFVLLQFIFIGENLENV